MNKDELLKIKENALERHIPIIMDDTLEVIDKYLTEKRPEKILEIGTAVGYSAMCFSEYLRDGGKIDTIERDETDIIIKELRDAEDESFTYAANWTYEGVSYTLSGKIELDELKKIIKYMKF